MLRCCSQCGSNGHNSRTCGESSSAASAAVNGGGGLGGGSGEIILFGVRVKVDPMRKSVSMNNLSQYVQPSNVNQNGESNLKNSNESEKAADDAGAAGGGGYVSADDAVQHQSTGGRERKRGIPWTEEEHKLFLLGLQKVGKGDWRGISRNFVKTRTPTQVASHAQKYYLRKSNLNRRRRRSSLFDITTDSVPSLPMEDGKNNQDPAVLQPTSMAPADASNMSGYAIAPYPMAVGPILLPLQLQNPLEIKTFHWGDQVQNGPTMFLRPVSIPVIPMATSSATADINLKQRVNIEPSSVSLRLSLSSDNSQPSTRQSGYQGRGNFSNGDSIISVA